MKVHGCHRRQDRRGKILKKRAVCSNDPKILGAIATSSDLLTP